MTDSTNIPAEPAENSPVAPAPATDASAAPAPHDPTPVDRPPRSRRRTLLLAGGAVVAAAVLAGGGIAIGAALADDDDDGDRTSMSRAADESRDGGDTRGDDERSGDDSAQGAVADIGTASADELDGIIASAAAVAEGEPISLDAERDGSWDVRFETTAGDETGVRVTADGTATVTSTDAADPDDVAPQYVLDAATVDALVSAALAEVDGRIIDLEIDDDPASPFDVTVLTGEGRTVEGSLDAAMRVLSTDRD